MFRLQFGLFIFVVATLHTCSSEEGSPCQTPQQEAGVCISIKICDPLITLLRSQGATPEVASLLRQSACGWGGNYPLVCCPQLLNKAGSTERIDINTPQLPESTSPRYSGVTLPRPPYCGYNNISKTRVVNGVPAQLGEYPWIVALGYRNPRNPEQPKWLCGGTMITDRHILTAGHCVNNRPDLYVARLGELDLYSDDDGAQPSTIALANAKIHEQYNPTSYTNDIAILTLAEPHNNPTVTPICLPIDEPLKSNDFVRHYPFVAGWGALYFNGPASPNLQTATLPVVTNEQCSRAFVNFRTTIIDQRVLCAGYLQGGKDACQGDSGGPLMFPRPDHKKATFFQIGVVSYGFRCAEQGYPGVYTRVTAFVDWIQQNLN